MTAHQGELSFRMLGVDDLGALDVLERAAQPLPWSEDQLLLELVHDDARVLGAERDGDLLGYIAVRRMLNELWVLNLAVTPLSRRAGLARALLDRGCREGAILGCTTAWLEVRIANVAARALYTTAGFTERGQRRLYYPPIPPAVERETAIVMARDL